MLDIGVRPTNSEGEELGAPTEFDRHTRQLTAHFNEIVKSAREETEGPKLTAEEADGSIGGIFCLRT